MKILRWVWSKIRHVDFLRILALRANSTYSLFQTTIDYDYFGVKIKIPSKHPLPKILKEQTRENTLKFLASTVFSDEKNHYIDVGANVGDTALLVEIHSPVPLESDLIEPSEFFQKYLRLNSTLLNNARLIQKFAASTFPTSPIIGEFHQWSGNAEIVEIGSNLIASAENQVNIARLIKVSTALVKIDCEGQDLNILRATFDQGFQGRPILYFECAIIEGKQLNKLRSLLIDLMEDYEKVVVTNPSGLLLYAGDCNENFYDLCRYQIGLRMLGNEESCYYFDIALFPRDRGVEFHKVLASHRNVYQPA